MKKLLILILILIPYLGFNQILLATAAVGTGEVETSILDSLTASVVAIYEFDDSTGTNVIDHYANLNGTNFGATINQSPLISDGGKSYYFDGTDYIDFNNLLIDDFPYFVSFWIKPDTISQQFPFISHHSLTGKYWGVAFDYNATYFAISYGNGGGTSITARTSYIHNYTFEKDSIYHIVVTSTGYGSSTYNTVYINGSEIAYSSTSGTGTYVSWVDATATSRVSQRWALSTTERFRGTMDQLIVGDEEIGAADVAKLYNQR